VGWAVFYATFVAAIAIHAPIGLRSVLSETIGWRGRSLDLAMLVVGIVLGYAGWCAVFAVVSA
jgi:fumarate reductase subunit C